MCATATLSSRNHDAMTARLSVFGGQNVYDRAMLRTVFICTLSFVAGAVLTATPFLIVAHFAHIDEAARGEETMGPGITTFLGLLASPVGGMVAALIAAFVQRGNWRKSESKSCNS